LRKALAIKSHQPPVVPLKVRISQCCLFLNFTVEVSPAPQVAKHKSKEEEKIQKKEQVQAVKNTAEKTQVEKKKKTKRGNSLHYYLLA